LKERVDRLEAYFGSQDEMVRELRDAVTVTAQLEARHSAALKDHGVWLVEHDKAMIRLDERIANLVSAIGK
jgi:hypothetical protein